MNFPSLLLTTDLASWFSFDTLRDWIDLAVKLGLAAMLGWVVTLFLKRRWIMGDRRRQHDAEWARGTTQETHAILERARDLHALVHAGLNPLYMLLTDSLYEDPEQKIVGDTMGSWRWRADNAAPFLNQTGDSITAKWRNCLAALSRNRGVAKYSIDCFLRAVLNFHTAANRLAAEFDVPDKNYLKPHEVKAETIGAMDSALKQLEDEEATLNRLLTPLLRDAPRQGEEKPQP